MTSKAPVFLVVFLLVTSCGQLDRVDIRTQSKSPITDVMTLEEAGQLFAEPLQANGYVCENRDFRGYEVNCRNNRGSSAGLFITEAGIADITLTRAYAGWGLTRKMAVKKVLEVRNDLKSFLMLLDFEKVQVSFNAASPKVPTNEDLADLDVDKILDVYSSQ